MSKSYIEIPFKDATLTVKTVTVGEIVHDTVLGRSFRIQAVLPRETDHKGKETHPTRVKLNTPPSADPIRVPSQLRAIVFEDTKV